MYQRKYQYRALKGNATLLQNPSHTWNCLKMLLLRLFTNLKNKTLQNIRLKPLFQATQEEVTFLNPVATCVCAFLEILQSLQYKISQYNFLRQYLMKFWDFSSLCKIQQLAWLQLDHTKFRPSEVRFSGPYIMKLKKERSRVRYTSLKNFE